MQVFPDGVAHGEFPANEQHIVDRNVDTVLWRDGKKSCLGNTKQDDRMWLILDSTIYNQGLRNNTT